MTIFKSIEQPVETFLILVLFEVYPMIRILNFLNLEVLSCFVDTVSIYLTELWIQNLDQGQEILIKDEISKTFFLWKIRKGRFWSNDELKNKSCYFQFYINMSIFRFFPLFYLNEIFSGIPLKSKQRFDNLNGRIKINSNAVERDSFWFKGLIVSNLYKSEMTIMFINNIGLY